MSARNGPKLPFLETPQLVFEVCHSKVGRGEFAGAVEQFGLDDPQSMRGIVECADLFAQSMDLAGPASLVRFLTVFGESGAFQCGRELGLQLGDIACAGRDGSGRGRLRAGRLVEEAIDAADATGCAVAAGELFAEARAGQDGVLCPQFLDQGEDRCVRESRRAGHGGQSIQLRKITETRCGLSLVRTEAGSVGPSNSS